MQCNGEEGMEEEKNCKLKGASIRGNHIAQISELVVNTLNDLFSMQQSSVLLSQHLQSMDHILVLLLELLSRLANGGVVAVAFLSVHLAVAHTVVLHQIQLILLGLFGQVARRFAEICNLKRRRCWR